MGFTTPCFIRKNTQELRRGLEELGYSHGKPKYYADDDNKYDFIMCHNGIILFTIPKEMGNGVVLLRLWQVPMGMDILLPVLTVCMILWNKL